MKNYIILLHLAFVTHLGFTQTDIKGSYQFTSSLPEELSSQTLNGKDNKKKVTKGSKITVVRISSDKKNVFYQYWHFPESKNTTSNSDSSLAMQYNDKLFVMPYAEFLNMTTPIYKRYKGATVGAYSVPFRLRGLAEEFDFESSLSLQSNLVFGFGKRVDQESWLDLSIGLGLTGVNLNDRNSNVTETRTASALTVSTGILLKPAKFANFGLFVGWDNLGANDREVNWEYNGKAWLGLGLNITFNEIKTTDSAVDRN